MTYATPSDMIKRFDAEELAQRADDSMPRLVTSAMLTTAAAGGDMSGYTLAEQDATAAALAVITDKLTDSDAMIDGYISGRYAVPLAATPRLILGIACDLARYALYDDIATEQIATRYKDAIKTLESISSGKISLGVDGASAPAASPGGAAQMESTAPVFSRGNGGFL